MSQQNSQYDFSRLNDLQVQAMMFGMEVDLETFDLVAIKKHEQRDWLIRWQDKQDESDFDTNFDIGDWDERHITQNTTGA